MAWTIEQNFIISTTINFLLLGLIMFVVKELGFKIKKLIFKRGVILRFITPSKQIHEHYFSGKVGGTIKFQNKQYFLTPKQAYFKKRVPVYTYIQDNSVPHDYIEDEDKAGTTKLNAQIFRDIVIMAETSGGDILKKLFQYRYVFLLVLGIAIGVGVVLVLVFQLNNWINTVEVCKVAGGGVITA